MWDSNKTSEDDTYSQILKRAKEQLPEHTSGGDRFTIPRVDSNVEGNRTFFTNFKDVLGQLDRSEAHLLKFLTNELGTSGNVEGTRAIFQGKHSRNQIIRLIERYVNDYVLCSECGKPDTHFFQQNRVEMMKCDACGASTAIRSLN